ncbi:hypothetical protein JL722_4882 [Aureococcus anophagefferens]|nr:hypothetical protein JL722_4882 [Aureococcus anophagefferens]
MAAADGDDGDAREALFWACRAGVGDTVRALLEIEPELATAELGAFEGHDVHGAVPLAANRRCYTFTGSRKDGHTYALHVAAESGHKALVRALVDVHGADPGARDYRGRAARDVANGDARDAFKEFAGLEYDVRERYAGDEDESGEPHGAGKLYRKRAGYEEREFLLYDGAWHHGRYHGAGALYHAGTDTLAYSGKWVHGVRHGGGRSFGETGALEYDGAHRVNKRHGFGRAYAQGKCVYEGRWRRGYKHGYGRLDFLDEGGESTGHFEGSFRDDKMCGAGTYFHANGDRYEGQFDDNAPDGHGSYYDAASGQRTDGTWDDGKLRAEPDAARPPGAFAFDDVYDLHLVNDSSDEDDVISDEEEAADPGTRRPAGLCRMPCRTAGGGDLNIATEYVHAAHVVHVDFVDQKHEPEVPRDFMVVYDIVAAYGRRARIDFMRFLANMTRRRHALEAALEASEAALVAGMTEELEALVDTLEPLPTGGNDQAARLLQVLIESRSAKTIYPPVDGGEARDEVDATLLEPPLKWGDGDDEPEYKTLEEALRSVDAVLAEVSAEVLAQDEEEQARSRRRARDDDEPEALDELLAQADLTRRLDAIFRTGELGDDDDVVVDQILKRVRERHDLPDDDAVEMRAPPELEHEEDLEKLLAAVRARHGLPDVSEHVRRAIASGDVPADAPAMSDAEAAAFAEAYVDPSKLPYREDMMATEDRALIAHYDDLIARAGDEKADFAALEAEYRNLR